MKDWCSQGLYLDEDSENEDDIPDFGN